MSLKKDRNRKRIFWHDWRAFVINLSFSRRFETIATLSFKKKVKKNTYIQYYLKNIWMPNGVNLFLSKTCENCSNIRVFARRSRIVFILTYSSIIIPLLLFFFFSYWIEMGGQVSQLLHDIQIPNRMPWKSKSEEWDRHLTKGEKKINKQKEKKKKLQGLSEQRCLWNYNRYYIHISTNNAYIMALFLFASLSSE